MADKYSIQYGLNSRGERVKRTRKACDACGGTDWREQGKVCPECQELLDEARAARVRENVDPEIGNYYLAERAYDLPYFHSLIGSSADYQKFQKLFDRLCHLLGEPITHVYARECTPIVDVQRVTRPGQKLAAGITVAMRKDVAECLAGIYAEALEICEASYQNGKDAGESFIRQLATGEKSITEYNEVTMRT